MNPKELSENQGAALMNPKVLSENRGATLSQAQQQLINQAIAGTMRSLAHELRKPLSMTGALLGAMAQETEPLKLRELAEKNLSDVQMAIEGASELLEDLFLITHLTREEMQEFSLEKTLQSSWKRALKAFPKADVQLIGDFHMAKPLIAAPVKIERLFVHLISILIKNLGDSGKIHASASKSASEGFLEIKLRGSPLNLKNTRIPDLFGILESDLKSDSLGLGGALAKRIVEQHLGSLRVSTRPPGSGESESTEFVVELPLQTSAGAEVSNLPSQLKRERRSGAPDRRESPQLGGESKESESQRSLLLSPTPSKPKVAFLDDTKIFRFAWKKALSTDAECFDFESPSAFFERCDGDPSFLASLQGIVTDFHFGPGEPLTGGGFAEELRKKGFGGLVILSSDGTFQDGEFAGAVDGVVSKEAQTWNSLTQLYTRSV